MSLMDKLITAQFDPRNAGKKGVRDSLRGVRSFASAAIARILVLPMVRLKPSSLASEISTGSLFAVPVRSGEIGVRSQYVLARFIDGQTRVLTLDSRDACVDALSQIAQGSMRA
jgi:hypothetical protein